MRTAVDGVRSLKRYAAEVLGDDWEVRLPEEQAAFNRPFALVGPAGPELWTGPAHHTEIRMPMSIHCYPAQGATPEGALLDALGVGDKLFEGFRVGVNYGGPMRVPLWDYAGVPLDQVANSRLAIEGEHDHWHGDYMRIADISVNRVKDPDEPSLYTVIADLRLGWVRPGRLPSEEETLRAVYLTHEGSS